mgnify:CR=1 FL=1
MGKRDDFRSIRVMTSYHKIPLCWSIAIGLDDALDQAEDANSQFPGHVWIELGNLAGHIESAHRGIDRRASREGRGIVLRPRLLP